MNGNGTWIRAAIVGASGYTGAELVRLLVGHPDVRIEAMTADRKAGQAFGAVFPHLAAAVTDLQLPPLVAVDDVDWSAIDVAFLGLPHGAAHAVARQLPERVRVVDLSPDFRFADPTVYGEWYGTHGAPDLQADAVYGLTEIHRQRIAAARIVGCPGCYPTASLLPLIPLIEAGAIGADDVIIDAKSGVSGAGRALKEGSLYAEVAEGIAAYGVAQHRHAPEIEQAMSVAAGRTVRVNFTPHLMPMNRGILASLYVRLAGGASADDLRQTLAERYQNEPFVRVLAAGVVPATRHVRGSNFNLIGVFADRLPGRAIILSVIDNLVKGAAGQAVQNMNRQFGRDERTGLTQQPLFP
ncbi:MAG: N-acetyl-gamma-glutamyl-phosphate reductase [Rhodospirillales bacterium]|jgi:N-acetyl-gamma-glutamyl-phosphate reductase|nr:N-acetyl-gamma-glutamyl-phosphate reductase [Rhodospirillales bacterium]